MVVGLLIGLASNSSTLSFLQDYTFIANINPRLMLLTFLPTLIFESAFIMDVHTFKKAIFQALVLACPGLIISAVLIAILARYVFTYNWSWVTAMLFGSIFSATDPVSVVALLKDLGKLVTHYIIHGIAYLYSPFNVKIFITMGSIPCLQFEFCIAYACEKSQ